MKYIQLIYCSKPICSSLANQAKNKCRWLPEGETTSGGNEMGGGGGEGVR